MARIDFFADFQDPKTHLRVIKAFRNQRDAVAFLKLKIDAQETLCETGEVFKTQSLKRSERCTNCRCGGHITLSRTIVDAEGASVEFQNRDDLVNPHCIFARCEEEILHA